MDHLSKAPQATLSELSRKHVNICRDNTKPAITTIRPPVGAWLPCSNCASAAVPLVPNTENLPAVSDTYWDKLSVSVRPAINTGYGLGTAPTNLQAHTCCTCDAERKEQACNRFITHFQCTGKGWNAVLLATTQACPILRTVK